MKLFNCIFASLIILSGCCSTKGTKAFEGSPKVDKVMIAYVTSWEEELPNPQYLTCINYAFGHVNETFNGVKIDNPNRLCQIVALKKLKPSLKVVLSIGGWGSGRFSEMAGNETNRLAFAKDCKRVIDEYGLDGVDFDWEYPGQDMAGISASANDVDNYTLLCRDTRAAIGKNKILSHATVCVAKYIDFKAVDQYMSYHNIMSYDMGMSNPRTFHSALYRSEYVNEACADEAVKAHLAFGIKPEKIVMGLAFYGRGVAEFPRPNDLSRTNNTPGYNYNWDEIAKMPYMTDIKGQFAFGYESLESIAIKAQYILDNNLKGAMYWDYSGDNQNGDYRRTVYQILNGTF